MSGSARPNAPTFRFGDPETNNQPFTFADGWVHAPDGSSTPRRLSDNSSRHLAPRGGPGRGPPRARSASPQYRFGDGGHHDFTFADGWVTDSSSSFGVGELRDALPVTGPRPSSSSGIPTPRPNLLPPAQVNRERASARYEDNPSAVYEFGQERPSEFSLRLLHNATPLPSREPSPQPTASGTGTDDGSGQLTVVAPPRSPESLSVLPTRAHTRNRTSDVSILSDLEEGDSSAPYDVRNEQAPAHRFFTAEFQLALRAGLGIAQDTLAALERLDGLVQNDRDFEKLLDDAKELCAFQASDTKTIAVLGDSGEGKSSLINSLLHFPGIAKTGDIGSACTSVVTEYRQKTREHTAPITIEVEHLSGSAIEEVVKELLWSYRQLYLPGAEDESTSAADYARYQRESAQAWSALEAAFRHKRGFREETLRDMSEGAAEQLSAQLVGWSREIEWPEGTNDGLWRSTADTAEECVEKTACFMQDRYWPFTKIIRVYLSSQVLKTGVVLADLPGLQDSNLARVRATHDYLLKCDHVFVVANISRAITDRSLQSSIFSVLSRHAPLEWEESAAERLRIAVVCTKAEDINAQAGRREFCGPGKPIPASVMDGLDEEIEKAKAAGDRMLKKACKQRRELVLINARNAHVTSGLQAAYAARAPGGHLDVFCVSNKWYDKYSRKGNVELVQQSGIPSLRQFCYSITADAQLREARHFLQASVFALVNSVELWVEGRMRRSKPERSELDESHWTVSRVNDGIMRACAVAIDALVAGFRSCFVREVIGIIDNRHPMLEDAAHAQAKLWRDWHWSQYDAWCRHNGHYRTGKRRADWNAEIIWKLRIELDYQWDIVTDEIDTVFAELLATVSEQFAALNAAISALPIPGEFRTQLSAVIGPRIEGCRYQLTRTREQFARDVNFLRRYSSEASDGSYILDAMIPTYRKASYERGDGKQRKQIDIVEGRITDGVLFPNAAIALQGRMGALLEDLGAKLTTILTRAVMDTGTDFRFVLAPHRETPQDDVGVLAAANTRERLRETLEALRRLKARVEDVRTAAAE